MSNYYNSTDRNPKSQRIDELSPASRRENCPEKGPHAVSIKLCEGTSRPCHSSSNTRKPPHQWGRPARNAGLPVIRHPGLRSVVQSEFPVGRASCPSLSDRQSRVSRDVPPKKGLLRCTRKDRFGANTYPHGTKSTRIVLLNRLRLHDCAMLRSTGFK